MASQDHEVAVCSSHTSYVDPDVGGNDGEDSSGRGGRSSGSGGGRTCRSISVGD